MMILKWQNITAEDQDMGRNGLASHVFFHHNCFLAGSSNILEYLLANWTNSNGLIVEWTNWEVTDLILHGSQTSSQ